MKRLVSVLTAALMLLTVQPAPAAGDAADVFCDDFSGAAPDPAKWLIAEKNWGGTVTENGITADYNGGVLAENVSLRDGCLVLTGYGNQYDGAVRGINRDGTRRADGKRCGAAIATREYFASGSYEIRARIAPELGCCSAMWTFEYEEDYSGDALKITNHEIDIEFPGRDQNDAFSLSHALCTTWQTEEDYKTKSVGCGDQADGAFHTYRFDWHTGSATETPRVEYYFDDVLTYTAYDFIPTNESRLWLGLWFPKNWAGTPDFDTETFMVDYVKITPFRESGDTAQHESYPDSGWAEPAAEPPRGWLLWHSYSSYAALDSRLYLRDPAGRVTEITGGFAHAMNGSFGRSPEQFTFMAIDRAADEWDIYLSDGGRITNLTQNSGCRNEDPKLSPDGRQIVFKRGKWDSSRDDFSYQLMLLDIETNAVTPLTEDSAEKAMPCFSGDGKAVYFTRYAGKIGAICRLDLQTHEETVIFSEPDVNAYYPIAKDGLLYFTKWYSAENHCDQLMCFDGGNVTALPFNSADHDCSDACPVGESGVIYSSTAGGSYDLYYYDGTAARRLTALCSGAQDLGAAFFPASADAEKADAAALREWLLTVPDADLPDPQAADRDGNAVLNAADLSLLKRDLM